MLRRALLSALMLAACPCAFSFASNPPPAALQVEQAFTDVSAEIGPAVVSISVQITQRIPVYRSYGDRYGRDPLLDRFFEEFFGIPSEREFTRVGLGSGVIIDTEGHILTNEHVVQGADRITVTLGDGREFEGTVSGVDSRTDLAVVKIDAGNLPVARLGDSDKVRIGQWAIAVGNPFGFAVLNPVPTVTVGVVSAVNRSLPQTGSRNRNYVGLIQTDASINPGNSGGPLVDIYGQVIGINVAIFSTSGGSEGIGFAIPINMAKRVLDDLKQGNEILYGWLGVQIQNVDQELADYFGLPDTQGVMVVEVLPGGPAVKAGLAAGDVIREYDGHRVTDVSSLIERVNMTQVGSSAALQVYREGRSFGISVNIGVRPEQAALLEEKMESAQELMSDTWYGIRVVEMTPDVRAAYAVQEESGVVVVEVEPGSPCDKAGLQVGDVVRGVDRRSVSTLEEFRRAVKECSDKALIRTGYGFVLVKSGE
ncbi:MAG: Do family serine endopeptidase [Candidatus Omnitrophica bacterium]|nr:Do family serine endopeptidase [Candidatus Omnitrophota bacterium]